MDHTVAVIAAMAVIAACFVVIIVLVISIIVVDYSPTIYAACIVAIITTGAETQVVIAGIVICPDPITANFTANGFCTQTSGA
jgi:hypothetical protein